jgi:uncharacterized protein (DUF2249 family)
MRDFFRALLAPFAALWPRRSSPDPRSPVDQARVDALVAHVKKLMAGSTRRLIVDQPPVEAARILGLHPGLFIFDEADHGPMYFKVDGEGTNDSPYVPVTQRTRVQASEA